MLPEELYSVYLRNPNIQTDSRKVRKGDLFFALKGPNFNGNAYAASAIDSGAAFAIIDDEAYAIEGKTILVHDVLTSLQQLANHHRKQFDIPFLAITGSNGKTTTKELIHAVLYTTLKTYTTEGNLNNHIGVPLTILKIKSDAQIAVIEMGANHLGEIASYCTIAMPTHGLITNCGKAHLEGFGSEEGVRKGKGELFDYLRTTGGTAFIMRDYDYLLDMSKGISTIYSYGTKDANVVGEVITSDPFLEVNFSKGYNGIIKTSLVGAYNLPNVLAAVAVGMSFKIPETSIKSAIENYQPSNSRSQLMEKGSNKIIVDAYNANPSSMKVAIENFAKTNHRNKFLVLGAMGDLGADSIKEHQQLVEDIKKYKWENVLLVGGDFMKIEHPYQKASSAAEAGEWLRSKNIQDAYILLKGSRSSQMEKVLDYI